MARKNDREYRVLSCGENLPLSAEMTGALAGRPACEKWIRERGTPGTAYYIVIFVGKPTYVHVEPTEKRTLATEPASEESADEEDPQERAEREELEREREAAAESA